VAASAVVISMGAANGGTMAHTPINTKTGVDGALALIEAVKAMLMKMVAAEEAKKAAPLMSCSCCHHPSFKFGGKSLLSVLPIYSK
jgi:hypothetical protein